MEIEKEEIWVEPLEEKGDISDNLRNANALQEDAVTSGAS